MDIENITIESLLKDDRIRKTSLQGQWYFSKDDLNDLFEDNFELIESTELSNMSPSDFLMPLKFISAQNIIEHVEYRRSMPSFKSSMAKTFKKPE